MDEIKNNTGQYEMIIQPSKGWFNLDFSGLWHYRDLLFLLVHRDFVSKYKQTILGPTWFILQPLLTTVIFTIVFGKVAKIPTDGVPHVLFYLCSLLSWNYFSKSLNMTSNSLITNASLFNKVYFPRVVIPLSSILTNLIAFALQFTIFLGFYAYYKFFTVAAGNIAPNGYLWMIPLLIILTATTSLGVGLWISALTAKYRDLTHLNEFIIQVWMYMTPIIYPLSVVPDQWKWVVALNPMTAIVEMFRYAFFTTDHLYIEYLLISAGMSLFILISGFILFKKVERTFVDTI